jgi:hypothetical protein
MVEELDERIVVEGLKNVNSCCEHRKIIVEGYNPKVMSRNR